MWYRNEAVCRAHTVLAKQTLSTFVIATIFDFKSTGRLGTVGKCNVDMGTILTWALGGGGYFRNFWLVMCRWDPGTSVAYTRASSAEFYYPILD